MNKCTYTSLIILLQIFTLVNTVHSAELRYGNKKQIKILPDGNNENLSLEKFFNLLNQQENNLNTSYTVNLLENINDNNQFYLLVDTNSTKSNKNTSTDVISSNSIRCSPTSAVNSASSARFAGIAFLAQSSNDNLFEDIYNALTQKDCQVVIDQDVFILDSLEDNDMIAFKPITLVDYTRTNTQFTPVQTNYIYLQTAQELNNISNSNLQTFNYRNNTQSLGLVDSALIKPIVPRTNTTKNNYNPNITNTANIVNAGKNNPVVSNKPAFPQATNTNTNFNSQPNLNYLNALSNSQITDFSSTTGISSYQNQVPSSPILDQLKKEREAQQKELNQRLEKQKRELQKQAEQRRREQERAEQNRRRQLEQQQRQRQQELVRQQQRQRQQSQSFR